ncbi:MAG: peptidase and in kexin sedolisin [Cyanobacteria bacterium RYN_339]|nr:peptidase and in kexin sedolisin [Cyanobacteria bacterium RYN_339]
MPVGPRQLIDGLLAPWAKGPAAAPKAEGPGKQLKPDELVVSVSAIHGRLQRQDAEAIATSLAGADAKADAALERLATGAHGMFSALPEQRYAQLAVNGVTATAGDHGHLLRVDAQGETVIYRDGVAVEDAHLAGQELVVHRQGREERWDANGTAATVNGKPLEVPPAPRVPGERPRGPWAEQPNRYIFPAAEANAVGPDLKGYDAFAKKLDENEAAIGARVIAPTSREFNYNNPNEFNCHSYGLTGGEGDLENPFEPANRLRWVNSPMFELTNGNWGKLATDQRAQVGDRILYRKDGVVTHTGVVTAVDQDGNPSRVQSKWGNWGLFEHAPFDVPNVGVDYGQPAELYRPTK